MTGPRKYRRLICCTLLLALFLGSAACSASTPTQDVPIPELTITPTNEPVSTEEVTEPETEGPVTLRIWVPPQFDPGSETPAGMVFQARLDECAARKPNIEIEVRSKNVDGYGGILDTLTTANAAAPLALPDLVALPRHGLETAAEVGLLFPYDGLTIILDDPDWYDYARQLSYWQNATFGIPFAGDALMMAFRPEIIPDPPVDWAATLALTNTLTHPAADPSAVFTLAQYQSYGGSLVDEDDQPFLDVVQLTQVLSYYLQSSAIELMPYWLTQYETDDQSWAAYEESQADLAVTWASRYLQTAEADTSANSIPTHDGVPFTLADGWVWAITTNDPDRQLLTAQLAEFLTTSEFLSTWTEAAGLMPPRPSATLNWAHQPSKTLVNQIAPAARLIPPLDLFTTLGPILQQATVSVLKAEAGPTVAAENAIQKLADSP